MTKRERRFVKQIALSGCLMSLAYVAAGRALSRGQDEAERLAVKAVALIESQCLQCHGTEKISGLDLRAREGLLKGGTRGAAVVPGQAAASLLYRMVAGEAEPRMPLGQSLSADEVALLKEWIDGGAPWPKAAPDAKKPPAGFKTITEAQRNYWAFRPPARPAVPRVKLASAVRNPIDAFILSALEAKGLTPSAPADRRTLLRRVTFDLTGLPPTPEEAAAFVADASPDAYEKVVARLLGSPRYGERWAQHWLDVARFAETNGFELDQDREQSWRYRDYVVRSLNEDKPYDRFILEQLAGDELEPDNFELRVATGFVRAGPQHVVAGNQDVALNRQEWLTEATAGVGNGILGLTVGCARCHDHKFDPIPQADYYRLQSFFAATDNHDFKRHTKEQAEAYQAAVKAHKERLKPVTDEIAAIEKPYRERLFKDKFGKLELEYAQALATEEKQRTADQRRLAMDARRMLQVQWDELVASIGPEEKDKRAALRRRMHAIELEAPTPLPVAPGVADKPAPAPVTHVLRGGDPGAPILEVEPRFLSVMLPPDAPPAAEVQGGRRTALARWLIRRDHPLTARVMVNRLWHHHFGRGIVGTPNDFGRHGQQPTHPELLDWLATEFVARGWSLKQMHALMVLSNTYRQSSAPDGQKAQADPENLLLWRTNRRRLDAEALRDAVLQTAGSLTPEAGGPPVRVPLEPEVYDTIFTEGEPDNLWPVTPDPRQHTRRSLYLLRKRNVRLPMLVAFDAPDMMSSCAARGESVHALQALTLMNSDLMLAQSRALAARLWRESGDERRLLARLYELALGRPPRREEIKVTEQFLQSQKRLVRQRLAAGEPVAELSGVDPVTGAAWIDLCLATLNLNEFIYVN